MHAEGALLGPLGATHRPPSLATTCLHGGGQPVLPYEREEEAAAGASAAMAAMSTA